MTFDDWLKRRAETFVGQFCTMILRLTWIFGALDVYHASQSGQRILVVFSTIFLYNITAPVTAAVEAWYLEPTIRWKK